MKETLLKVENLKVEFDTEDGIVKALDDISFEIERKKIFGLVGESGCGKSVTANTILNLIPKPPGRIVNGQILFEGNDLLTISADMLREIRGGEISMIFQDPFTSLNPVYTVGRQISEAIKLHQEFQGYDAMRKAAEIMGMVGIPEAEKRLKDYPHQFSGGMRQRVMIAMALSCNPTLLIADEPTTALDVTIQAQILQLMNDLNQKMDMAILFISHDLGVISEMCDHIAIMYAGCIVESAEAEVFFNNPLHPYSEGLLGSIPIIGEHEDMLSVIPGNVPNLTFPPMGCRFHPRCSYVMDRCRNEKPVSKEVTPGHKVACFNVKG